MGTQLVLLVQMVAGLFGQGQLSYGTPGFDPTSDRCRFYAARSDYGYELEGPEPGGALVIEWNPGDGTVFRYDWYLARANPTGPYSSLSVPARFPPKLTRHLDLGPWVLSAPVDSHTPTGSLGGRLITAVMFPRHGGDAEWHFAGINEETASAYISATGTVHCK